MYTHRDCNDEAISLAIGRLHMKSDHTLNARHSPASKCQPDWTSSPRQAGENRQRQVVIVEDDPNLHRELVHWFEARAMTVAAASTVRGAIAHLRRERPDVLVLDVCLPDGRAPEVLAAAIAQPSMPRVLVISAVASPMDTFELGQYGACAFLQKPFNTEQLAAAVDATLSAVPDTCTAARLSVGHRNLQDLEGELRTAMIREALSRAKGSRRGAAKLLGVSRQFVQHVLRQLEETPLPRNR